MVKIRKQTKKIEIGVPQGSCLGPLLSSYIDNDLLFCLKHCQTNMYANDTSISFSTKNIDDLITTINKDLVFFDELFCGSKLSLDVVKTQAMVIGSKHKLSNLAIIIRIQESL